MKDNPIIRKANIKDSKIIIELNRRFFHEKGRDWKKLIFSKHSEMFVLELNKKIIGFTGLKYHNWNNVVQIINIFIHPNYRRKSYGTKLIKFLIKYLRKKKYRTLTAEAPSLNPALIFYLKNGFRICGFHDRYYSNKGKEMALFLSYDL